MELLDESRDKTRRQRNEGKRRNGPSSLDLEPTNHHCRSMFGRLVSRPSSYILIALSPSICEVPVTRFLELSGRMLIVPYCDRLLQTNRPQACHELTTKWSDPHCQNHSTELDSWRIDEASSRSVSMIKS